VSSRMAGSRGSWWACLPAVLGLLWLDPGCGTGTLQTGDGGGNTDTTGGNDTGGPVDQGGGGNDTVVGQDPVQATPDATSTPDAVVTGDAPPPVDMSPSGPQIVTVSGNVVSTPFNMVGQQATGRDPANFFDQFDLALFDVTGAEPFGSSAFNATCTTSNCSGTVCDYSCGQLDLTGVSLLLYGVTSDARTRNQRFDPTFCGLAGPPDIATAAGGNGDLVTNFYVVTRDTFTALATLISQKTGQRISAQALLDGGIGVSQVFDPWMDPNTPGMYSPQSRTYNYPPTTAGVTVAVAGLDGTSPVPIDVYYVTDDLSTVNGTATGATGMFVFVPNQPLPAAGLVFSVTFTSSTRTFMPDLAGVFPGMASNNFYVAAQ
jgi:hypothetical protein